MAVIHIISHTHWDREWYQTFQTFRMRLVHLMDKLLEILKSDPEYKHFMLDGQTVVLEDYLDIRPEKEAELKAFIKKGRILIGPWRCLPDEFLVSGEAIIRNLIIGKADCRKFGAVMPIGYIPDTFGHISQLPQIFAGFGFRGASLARGLSDEPVELIWEAPDGTGVLLSYLRDHYGNASFYPAKTGENSPNELKAIIDSLLPHIKTGHVLLMQGTDHLEPDRTTPDHLKKACKVLKEHKIIHSTLTQYFDGIFSEVDRQNLKLPVIKGELRSPARNHLLPGVLSMRMWIKQDNHACETLLEKLAEPASAWARLLKGTGAEVRALKDSWLISDIYPFVKRAWKLLLECHPHDSICGCSIDEVHEEMHSRFDQVMQIGENAARHGLTSLGMNINTSSIVDSSKLFSSILVYNPASRQATQVVTADILMPIGSCSVEIVDADGNTVPYEIIEPMQSENYLDSEMDKAGILGMIEMAKQGKLPEIIKIYDIDAKKDGDCLKLEIGICDVDEVIAEPLALMDEKINTWLNDDSIKDFHLRVRIVKPAAIRFLAKDVPGIGYAVFGVKKSDVSHDYSYENSNGIENSMFAVKADMSTGTLTVTDKRTGIVFKGLNSFRDGGNKGDEYNYCPPENDRMVSSDNAEILSILAVETPCARTLEIHKILNIPQALTEDRKSRDEITLPLEIITRVSISDNVERIDIETYVENLSSDHRLRVHFPTPFKADSAFYDGHFDVIERPLGCAAPNPAWPEDARPEVPQKSFTDVNDSKNGMMIASRGLPEVEVIRTSDGSEIALTLLNCVGWLSRDDFANRRGHAGPPLTPTPDAQMIGGHAFYYSIIPHKGGCINAANLAYSFNSPMTGLQTTIHKGSLPASASMLKTEPQSFIISTIKPAEDGKGIIVRGYSIADEVTEVSLKPLLKFKTALRVMLDETAIEPVTIHDGVIRFSARPREIVTIRLK
ncbi:MAG TPA: glycosyl hydrolase-related protein [Desulfomonilia bacterium]